MTSYPELMTVKEAANYLNIPVPTVYYLIKNNRLPAVQIGGRWRLKRDLIDAEILGKQYPSVSHEHRALVVEPNSEVRTQLCSQLEANNIEFQTARTGFEASEHLKTHSFDLAFMDLQLPDIGGGQAYLRFHRHNPEMSIVIIATHADGQALTDILAEGPAMVMKPPIVGKFINQIVDSLD